jgi:hypothetical protein
LWNEYTRRQLGLTHSQLNGDVMPKVMRHQNQIAPEGLIALILTVAICFLWIVTAIEMFPGLKH